MAIVGMLEGMQIAFFAVARMTDEERSQSYWAKRTCDVLFEGDGRNLPGFMVGRQMCVTLCFFIIARGTCVRGICQCKKKITTMFDGYMYVYT
jgi:Silicon transporter